MQTKATIRRPPLLEVIVCSVSDAIEAQRGGAGRLEIIRDLQSGGLTPPLELVQEILDVVTLPVRVMLRETNSYEVTGHDEKEKLFAHARELSELNVDGVVLGFLSKEEIDVPLTKSVLTCAPNLAATFHHAFEEANDPFTAIRVLKQLKQVDRILASGGTGPWTEKIKRLSRYEAEVESEIEILVGGGVDQQSIGTIRQSTGIREFHVGRAARKPASPEGVVSSELVKALVETLHEH